MSFPSRRTFALGLSAAAAALASMPKRAQAAYPERPITMIVPFGAGGAVDIIARILSEPLTKDLGQPVVVENRTGAGGNIGVGTAARAVADGYTILMASSSFAINPSLFPKVPYDPFKDFAPIADIGSYPCLIAARNDLGMNTVADLVAYAKANPDKLNYATPGTGTTPHLAVELLKLRANIAMIHVPYAGGGQAVQALLSGTVEVASLATPQAQPQVKAGRIKALALTGRERWPDLPDLPTLVESGYPDVIAETWQGFLAPGNTPGDTVNRLAQETIAVMQRPDMQTKFRQIGLVVTGQGPDALRARIASEVPLWKEVIDRGGIKPD